MLDDKEQALLMKDNNVVAGGKGHGKLIVKSLTSDERRKKKDRAAQEMPEKMKEKPVYPVLPEAQKPISKGQVQQSLTLSVTEQLSFSSASFLQKSGILGRVVWQANRHTDQFSGCNVAKSNKLEGLDQAAFRRLHG